MDLTFEEIVVLSNTPAEYKSKSTVIYGAFDMLPKLNIFALGHIMDCLVTKNLIQRKAGSYKLSQDGLIKLKENVRHLNDTFQQITVLTLLK